MRLVIVFCALYEVREIFIPGTPRTAAWHFMHRSA
jgi:hypothetical protein